MKQLLVLVSSVMVAGCFICHRAEPQKDIKGEEIAQVQSPAPIPVPAPKAKVAMPLNFPEAANFAFDSSKVRPDANHIDELVKALQEQPNADIYIEGHTDNIGSEEYNKKLSLRRANAVAEELKKRGISAERIHVSGAGFSKPIASNDTQEGRAHNRRVDVTLIKN